MVDALCVTGVLERSVGEVRARLDLRPYADENRDWWVLSDLTPGLDGAGVRVSTDHVLGISSASSSLAQLTVREPAGRALDLGTGCGVQSLHLADHVDEIVATDVNPRALWMTRLNFELNRVHGTTSAEVRDGSLYEPVRGELFDLVVTNPPFVISPATGERLVYRDPGCPATRSRRVVTGAPRTCGPAAGARCSPTGCTSTACPGTSVSAGSTARLRRGPARGGRPAQYVERWLKDAGLHGTPQYAERYDTWLSWFEEQRITGVGFGWLNLHKVGEPGGSAGSRCCGSRSGPTRSSSRSARRSPPGGAVPTCSRPPTTPPCSGRAWSPGSTCARRPSGPPARRTRSRSCCASSGGCGGPGRSTRSRPVWSGPATATSPPGRSWTRLATLLDAEPPATREAYLPKVRELVAEGFLAPAGR